MSIIRALRASSAKRFAWMSASDMEMILWTAAGCSASQWPTMSGQDEASMSSTVMEMGASGKDC